MSSSSSGGASGRKARTAGGAAWMCCSFTLNSLVPMNGGRPASISNSTQPSAYRSLRGVSVAAWICSGGMYAGVPRTCPV